MSQSSPSDTKQHPDRATGDRPRDDDAIRGFRTYLVGFGFAVLLTTVSFLVASTSLVWGPSIPVAIFVLAVAQMGVHLVFFLHIGTAPDDVNDVMALAFGVLIVALIIGGSLWIMGHLNHNMMPMDRIEQMQR